VGAVEFCRVAELEREISGSKEKAIDVDFAIENLYAAGLLNVTGDLVSGEQVLSGYNSLYKESL